MLDELRRQTLDGGIRAAARDAAEQYLQGASARRVFPSDEALARLKELPATLPPGPAAPAAILSLLHVIGSPTTVSQVGGRYFGFVNGGCVPGALAAKWLADAWDQNAGLYVMSPIASALEAACESWLVDLLGLPQGTGMGLVGGTSVATLCGLAAGRDELLRRAGWDAGARGLFGAPEIRVVLGAQAHASVLKALGLLGLGRERVETAPVDDQGRIDPRRLPRLDGRTLLILQAGNVSTGAFDPFAAIIPAAREAGAWVHVDGAFGLWAAASPRQRGLMTGAEQADSWSVDAHKTLNAPYDNGLVFCRSRDALANAMRASGAYFILSEQRDGMLYTPDMSRRARGVELWATLLSLGKEGVAELVDGLCANARLFGDLLRAEGFTVHNEIVFNQVLVSCDTEELTRATLDGVQRSGECWCGGTSWNGRAAMRVSVCSFMTTEDDVRRSVRAFVAARDAAEGKAR
ncbi:MAG TPA: aminotransferase class V-fold PLP-dependent enzyme [Spirochaetia bacterium]